MAKKAVKNKVSPKNYEKYVVKGDAIERKGKFCPKCGEGVFLAQHKNRSYCGKCHYTEFGKKE